MNENGKPQISEPLQDVCPHLALMDDPETFSAYPSKWNACYNSKPVSTPILLHQRDFCLDENHVSCLLYQTSKRIKMPKEMQNKSTGLSSKTKSRIRILIWSVIILIIFLAVIIGSRWLSNPFNLGPDVPTPTGEVSILITADTSLQTETRVFVPIYSSTAITQNTPTVTIPIPTSTSTITPTTPPLALDTPIGLENEFVIHRVIEGESLLLFANWYRTSPEAIQAINIDLSYPIQIDDLVIIPIGITDVTALPEFEAYEVLDEGISVLEQAEQIGVPVEDLCFYNNLDENQILHSGDWLIVPHLIASP